MPTTTLDVQGAVQQFRSLGTIFDRFPRANSGSSLGNTETGQTWVAETGSGQVYGISEEMPYAVSGAAALIQSGTVVESNLSTLILIETNVRVSEEYGAGLVFRSDGIHGGNKWLAYLQINSSEQCQLFLDRISAGSITNVATVNLSPNIPENAFVKLGVTLIGANIKVWVDDVLVAETNSATHQTRTKHGLIVGKNGIKFADNFAIRHLGGNPGVQIRANLLNTTTREIQIRASVRKTIPVTTELRAKITDQQTSRLTMRAYLLSHAFTLESAGDQVTGESPTRTVHEDAWEFSVDRVVANGQDVYIWTLDTQFLSSRFANLALRANIRGTSSKTIQLRARLTNQVLQTFQIRGFIQPRFSREIEIRARLTAPPSQTIQLKGSIQKTTSQTVQIRARIRRIEFDLQMQANIRNAVDQTIQMRASITPQELQRIEMQARILQQVSQTIQIRARIQPETFLYMRARLRGPRTAELPIEWNVLEEKTTFLPLQWNVGSLVKTSQVLQMRAKIASPRTATLELEWNVNADIPDGPVMHPTQRLKSS